MQQDTHTVRKALWSILISNSCRELFLILIKIYELKNCK